MAPSRGFRPAAPHRRLSPALQDQSNRPIPLHRDGNTCQILTSVPNPPRLPIRSGASMCAVVTVAPSVTTIQAGGVIGGPQGPAACRGRQRTPVRSRMDTLGIARQPP
jgi:hypothetical protein